MNDDKFNVPGSIEYKATEPLDAVLRAHTDQELRGYWLGRDTDGQVCLISNQNDADQVTLGIDTDGTPIVNYTDESEEFSYDVFDDYGVIRVRRYS